MKKRKEVIRLKKISLIITVLLLLSFFSPALAKNDKVKTNNSKANRAVVEQGEETNNEDTGSEEEGEDEGYVSPSQAAKNRNALRKLEKIQETTNDPEIGGEVEEIVEEQEEVQEQVEESLDAVDNRPAVIKFLIGPDFKNLGQLRKEIVHTRNNIRKLEQIREKVAGETQIAVDEAINELETTSLNLQASIGEKLEGFSLFGWLARWLSGFDAPDEPSETPGPSVEPTISPEPTGSPEATTVPTEAPTGSPSASPVESPTATVVPEPSPETTQ